MKKLLIVQNRPTQFDVPLYNLIASEGPFELVVIYSQTGDSRAGYDPEIGRSPGWDHIEYEDYKRIDLTGDNANNTSNVLVLIKREAPDFILLSGYFPPLHRKLVKPLKRAGYRVGLRSDNTLPHSNFSGLKGLAKKVILPIWLKSYDVWFPVGSLSKLYLEKISGVRKPTFLFPYNVDNRWFHEKSQSASEVKSDLLAEAGFPQDSFVVLGIMKWHEREDPLTLIEAFKLFANTNSMARLLLVGDGPMRNEVKSSLESIRDLVFTPGYVSYSKLPSLYAISDVFVHPSPDEPWGVSVNEAMACGVPVLAAEGVGAATDLIVEGETGFVFGNGNTKQLAGLLTAIDQQNKDLALSNACRAKMKQWSYRQTIEAFAQVTNGT